LIAATQGRAIWVLDDVTPLRYLNPTSSLSEPILVPPASALRVSKNENRDTPLPPEMPTTPNPPIGAVIDYYLPQAPTGPVMLEVVDEKGEVIRKFRSDDKPERPEADRYFAEFWLQPLPVLPAHAGHNRFVWNLRCPRPKAMNYNYSIAAVPGQDTPILPQGILALPGQYTLRLTVDGKQFTQRLNIVLDPRSKAKQVDLESQLAFYQEVSAALESVSDKYESGQKLDKKLEEITSSKVKAKNSEELADAQRKRQELAKFFAAVNALDSLTLDLEAADGPPTSPQRQLYQESKPLLQKNIQ
jgi:hypothetical protein